MPTKMQNENKTIFGLTNPGDFAFDGWVTDTLSPTGFSPTRLVFLNPHCRFNQCSVNITRGEAQSGVAHHWDGNLEKPTITPSIGCKERPWPRMRCEWHGHITNGEILP